MSQKNLPYALLHEIRDIIDLALVQVGIPAQNASDSALIAANAILDRYQGVSLYFPFSASVQVSRRNLNLLRDHQRGLNIDQLAQRYRLSIRQVQRIVRTLTAGDDIL